MSDNPYPDGDGMKLNMGRNTMNYELHTAWDEGYAEGFAAGRAAATPDPPDDREGLIAAEFFAAGLRAASPDERLREAAWPVELEVCPGCGVIIDIDAASCGCECPPRRKSKTFYLLHEADFLALAAADREKPEASDA